MNGEITFMTLDFRVVNYDPTRVSENGSWDSEKSSPK